MRPVIGVITPSFNQGRFIDRTIRSVLSQEIEGLEYMVVDGGSSDETVDILKRWGGVLRWVSEPDRGQAHAVNKGIRMTRGEIIGWVNSDDIYYPGALKAVMDYFERHPEADILYGDADHIDARDRVLEPYRTRDWDYERLKEICFLCQPAVFFRRRLVERVGLLDERLHYCMDYEYWLRIGRIAPFHRLRETLAGSRLYAENKTLGARVAVHREMNDMLRRRLGRVPAKWILAFAHVSVNRGKVDRSGPWMNGLYLGRLVLAAGGAFLRWRQTPTPADWRTMARWGIGALGALRAR
ncbi:MAG: glycosyltransferase family 2 protein [Desulfococcaceae bacterium]